MHVLLLGLLGNPTHDLFLLDNWLPLLRIPLKLCGFFVRDTWRSTDKDYTGLIAFFDLYKAQDKHVGVATNEAFNSEIPEFSLGMRGDLVMFGLHQMKDQM